MLAIQAPEQLLADAPRLKGLQLRLQLILVQLDQRARVVVDAAVVGPVADRLGRQSGRVDACIESLRIWAGEDGLGFDGRGAVVPGLRETC